MAIRPDELEDLFVSRVEALDASTFDQAPGSASFHVTSMIGVDSVEGARSIAHLSFDVVYDGTEPFQDERIARSGPFAVRSGFALALAYNVRRGDFERIDRKLAYRAAWAALGAIVTDNEAEQTLDFDVVAAAFNRDTGLLFMEASVSIVHEMSF